MHSLIYSLYGLFSQVVAISREEELGTADSLRKVGFKKLFYRQLTKP